MSHSFISEVAEAIQKPWEQNNAVRHIYIVKIQGHVHTHTCVWMHVCLCMCACAISIYVQCVYLCCYIHTLQKYFWLNKQLPRHISLPI